MAHGLIRLQEELHHRVLKLRSIESMVRRPQFGRLWDDSSSVERKRVQEYIDKAQRSKVAAWIRNHPSLELEEKHLIDLKKIAQRAGIPHYSRLGKLELIRLIQNEEKYATQQSIST